MTNDLLKLPEPGTIAEDVESFLKHYEKHNIKIFGAALGPSEYLRLCSYFLKDQVNMEKGVLVQQFMGKKIMVKTEPGMSAILHDNRDVFQIALEMYGNKRNS